MSKQTTAPSEPVRDARKLGVGKMLILGIQHMFAMFGATVLVPIVTGLSVQVTLICAGLGTLFFHLCTKFKVPAFLGSSFAFLGGFAAVKMLDTGIYAGLTDAEKLPYACGGIVVAGLFVSGLGRGHQSCWRSAGNAISAACSHRPDHHFDRTDSGSQCCNQRLGKLVAGGSFGDRCHCLQYVGKGYDQDHPNLDGCTGSLCGCFVLRHDRFFPAWRRPILWVCLRSRWPNLICLPF